MNKETKDLIKDLLIYLDVLSNYEKGNYLNNDYMTSIKIITHMQSKHADFTTAHKRHNLIKEVLEVLEKDE